MSDKVLFGLTNVHIAFRDGVDMTGKPKFKTPVRVPGVVGFAPDASIEEDEFYADNEPYYKGFSNSGYVGDLEVALFPQGLLAEMLGWYIDGNGMLVEVAGTEGKEFALLYEVDGDNRGRRYAYYNCKGSVPKSSYKTNEKSRSFASETMQITASQIDVGYEVIDGRTSVIKAHVSRSSDPATWSAFFDKVQLPEPKGGDTGEE